MIMYCKVLAVKNKEILIKRTIQHIDTSIYLMHRHVKTAFLNKKNP